MKVHRDRQSDTQSFGFFTNPLMSTDAYTQTHERAKAAGQTAVRNIWWGQTPTCQSLSMLCLYFSRDAALVKKKQNKTSILQMQSNEATKTHIWLRFLSVLAKSSSLFWMFQHLWKHTRRKHGISLLNCTQWTNSGANDLLTYWATQDTARNWFLSLYLFSHGFIIVSAGVGYLQNHVHKQYYHHYY